MADQTFHRIQPRMTKRAKDLRKDSTFPERLLWSALRGGRLAGLKFRRQHVIGPYVVDFFCAEHRLIVELDGMSHVGQASADHQREEFLHQQGCGVIQFANDDI